MNSQRFKYSKEKKPSLNGVILRNLNQPTGDASKTTLKCVTGENGLQFMINVGFIKSHRLTCSKEVMISLHSAMRLLLQKWLVPTNNILIIHCYAWQITTTSATGIFMMKEDFKVEDGVRSTRNVNSIHFQRFNHFKEKRPSLNGAENKKKKLLHGDASKKTPTCATGIMLTHMVKKMEVGLLFT